MDNFFISIFLLLEWYAFQGVKKLDQANLDLLGVLDFWNFSGFEFRLPIYHRDVSRAITPGRGYAIGLMLMFMLFYLIFVLFMFGEDIARLTQEYLSKVKFKTNRKVPAFKKKIHKPNCTPDLLLFLLPHYCTECTKGDTITRF